MNDLVKPLIYDLDQAELEQFFASLGEPPYRAAQVWQGLYRQLWNTPQDFTSLPLPLRQKLAESFRFTALVPERELASADRETVKTLFRLPDGLTLETVLMRYTARRTLCISSQVGCAMGCVFCATGQMGLQRNLTSGEILAQVLYFARKLRADGQHLTNVVIMGMGEPFHNYDATLEAVDRLNDPHGFQFGERRFTISTVGLAPKIRRFADEKRQINLAISLHAADDALRSSLLPINKKYPIQVLLSAARYYVEKTGRRITFEWALIQDANDSEEHARRLARLLKGLLCHVNVIPLNPTGKYAGQATTRRRAQAFQAALARAGIPCSLRVRRGVDIRAGCGQLSSEAAPHFPA